MYKGFPISENAIARTAVELWHGDLKSIHPIGNSANRIYSFLQFGTTRYLRLASSRNRTKDQLEAELDFIAHLRRGGVNATAAVYSASGRFIEEIPSANDLLLGCVFEEAKGERFRYDLHQSNKEHFRLRGRTLGRIHALSKNYSPSGRFRRFAWDEDKLLLEADEFLPKSEKVVWHAYRELREWLQDHPKSGQTYGLIHGDFGETNYLHREGELNIFDFDDCCYHWFVNDLAITIYPHGWRKDGLQLLDWLLEGYSEQIELDVTLTDITRFCRWRLAYMFLVYARKWGLERLSDQQAGWFAHKRENLMRGYSWCA